MFGDDLFPTQRRVDRAAVGARRAVESVPFAAIVLVTIEPARVDVAGLPMVSGMRVCHEIISLLLLLNVRSVQAKDCFVDAVHVDVACFIATLVEDGGGFDEISGDAVIFLHAWLRDADVQGSKDWFGHVSDILNGLVFVRVIAKIYASHLIRDFDFFSFAIAAFSGDSLLLDGDDCGPICPFPIRFCVGQHFFCLIECHDTFSRLVSAVVAYYTINIPLTPNNVKV